jgi:hypothetical protein
MASLGMALIAPFAHETGVLMAPLLVLLLLAGERPMPLRKALRRHRRSRPANCWVPLRAP